jgi:hypothetical protein
MQRSLACKALLPCWRLPQPLHRPKRSDAGRKPAPRSRRSRTLAAVSRSDRFTKHGVHLPSAGRALAPARSVCQRWVIRSLAVNRMALATWPRRSARAPPKHDNDPAATSYGPDDHGGSRVTPATDTNGRGRCDTGTDACSASSEASDSAGHLGRILQAGAQRGHEPGANRTTMAVTTAWASDRMLSRERRSALTRGQQPRTATTRPRSRCHR